MTELQSLKMEALDYRHYIERLLSFLVDFQEYVEQLAPLADGDGPGPRIAEAYERFRLSFQEYEAIFLEWHEGDRIVNPAIGQFLDHADEFRGQRESFEFALSLATTKFQHLLSKEERGASRAS